MVDGALAYRRTGTLFPKWELRQDVKAWIWLVSGHVDLVMVWLDREPLVRISPPALDVFREVEVIAKHDIRSRIRNDPQILEFVTESEALAALDGFRLWAGEGNIYGGNRWTSKRH